FDLGSADRALGPDLGHVDRVPDRAFGLEGSPADPAAAASVDSADSAAERPGLGLYRARHRALGPLLVLARFDREPSYRFFPFPWLGQAHFGRAPWRLFARPFLGP